MDKLMSSMMITLAFDASARALREPDKFDQATRESLATILMDLGKQTKGMVTGELMDEALRETNKEGV